MERPFNPKEIEILNRGKSPKPDEADPNDNLFGCLVFIFPVAYAILGMALNSYFNLFWSVVLPWPIIGLVYVLFRFSGQGNASRQFGHALVETVRSTDVRLNQTTDGYTIKVVYEGGEITWTGKISIWYYGETEAGFRQMLEREGINTIQSGTAYNMRLDALLAVKSNVLWVRFIPDNQTSAYSLPYWSLKDYFRTEYNLIRSSKTGALLFINLVSGTKDYFGNNISFDGSNITYARYDV